MVSWELKERVGWLWTVDCRLWRRPAVDMDGDVAAIVPAAGAGRRVGGRTSKLFLRLHTQPLLLYTLRVLEKSPVIRWIVLVTRSGERAQAAALLARYHITKALPPCVGGPSRAESVARGFAALPRQARWILVHDGARPCISRELIQRSVRAAKRHGAAACGLPATLTVKAVDDRRRVRETLDRDRLWLVQTPQVFRRDWFAQALAREDHSLARFPDDAALLEAAGFRVTMIPGDPLNLKVTTREDFVLAEAILRSRVQKSEIRRQKSDKSLIESDL